MATNFASMLDRTLAKYQPEDGEHIDLSALNAVLPMMSHRSWASALLGCGAGGRTHKIKRLPLLGRRYPSNGKWRVVVLVDSLRIWLEHHNPDKERSVEAIIEEMRKTTKRHEQKRRMLRIEARLKNPLGPVAKHHGEKTPSAHPLDKMDLSAMGAWG